MEIKGKFTKYIYFREDNGYTVALFELSESLIGEEIVVNGYIGKTDKEREYRLIGEYVEHPKYGMQFKVEAFEKIIASSVEDLIKYFSSEQFKGIGKKFATTLVETLGEDAISKIKADNDILDTVEKMNKKRKEAIIEGLKQEMDDNNIFLTTHHLTMKNIIRLKKQYGDDLMALLLENPYQAIRDVSGIGFATMDKFALSIGFDENNIHRLAALAENELMNMCMANGDTYILYDNYYQRLLKIMTADIDSIIDSLIMDRRVILEDNRVYHYSQYDSETYISRFLYEFPFVEMEKPSEFVIAENLREVESRIGITYQQKQHDAIMEFFENDVLILTGGPGTGKTTIVRGMIELSRLIYPQRTINLIAPTGRAAKRLAELTGCDAKTIHSLLLWDKETGKFAKNEDDPLNIDILIIDEFSMVDQYLFACLLKACGSMKKLVIIGDADQLPSVAMGAVLRDLIESERFTTIKLDRIYRQREGSDIISLAYDIRNEVLEDIPVENDIRFFECAPTQIKDLTLQIVEHALNNYSTLEEGFMNVQVLVPKHAGLNGINNMNVALQKKFNPPSRDKNQLNVGYRTFREMDKVIQLKNQPDDDVFNGDIGVITEVVLAKDDINNQNRIFANFDGRMVEYTSETFANLTHAYCVSVHKAQGSEYPIVIVPMSNEYGIMLQKRLIYTAVTRAYKSLIFIGEKSAFYKGITTKDMYVRHTTLKERLLDEQE